jgi:hypothetical protein
VELEFKLRFVILATWEAEIGKIVVQGQPESIVQSKMYWRHGSDGRVPALQA